MMPADRQYTKIEAAYFITADIQDGTLRSANAYAKQFGWDHKRVQRFMLSNDLINLNNPTNAQEQSNNYIELEGITPSGRPKMLAKVSAQQMPKNSQTDAQEEINDCTMLDGVTPNRRPRTAQQTPNVFNREKERENTSVLFEQFYAAYPKHQNRSAAIKAFQKLNPSPQLFQQMMDAIAWQIQQPDWCKNNGQFIPLPASWINGHRWEDERPATAIVTATGTADGGGSSAEYLRQAGLIQ